MPQCKIDDMLGDDGFFPPQQFGYAAASAAAAVPGASTSFEGLFIDALGAPLVKERWDVVHAAFLNTRDLRRFESYVPPQDRVEYGAIAIVAAMLHSRNDLRLIDVRDIGTHADYGVLRLVAGRVDQAGVIEVAGTSERYTSAKAERKRESVRKSKERPARIGVVAFGGPEVRIEVVA